MTMGSMSNTGMGGMDQQMQDAIQNALNCHAVCVQTLQHCVSKGGMHAQPEHIKVLEDCAQICVTSADFMLRQSQLHARVCGVCADACDACARSCGEMNDDAQMQACIDACIRCGESCRRMAQMA